MKNKFAKSILIVLLLAIIISCESEAEKKQRLAKIEKERIELERQQQERERLRLIEKAKDDSIKAVREEERRKEKEIYDRYINNSLKTGDTPYSYCFGNNKRCSDYGCSEIRVRTPYNSDVLVTIKKNGKVYRHAYIKAGSSYSFEFPNGTYQPFFYYGKGWNPNKVMKESSCGIIKGGFISNEHFGKDDPQFLSNNILEYELILQQNGNFSTRPSSSNEAF